MNTDADSMWSGISSGTTVWVVTSDLGENGHLVHGVFATKPTPEHLAMCSNQVSGDASYRYTRAQPMILDVPFLSELAIDNCVYVYPYNTPGP